jgi:ribonuclease BN (tRNA processing enzyme)
MELIIVGTGVGVPSLRRSSPALLIKIGEELFLFDSGPGSLREIIRAGFSYLDINRVFYTHFHVDHIADLPALLFAYKYPLDRREKTLPIVGPKGLKDFYSKLLSLYGAQLLSDFYEVEIKEMEEGVLLGESWKIITRPLVHVENCIGYRIECEGKIVVYPGDTDYTPQLLQLSEGCDVLILECSFPQKVEGHLTPSLAGEIAREVRCNTLLLTHFYPVCDEFDILSICREKFDGKIILAHDLMRLEI